MKWLCLLTCFLFFHIQLLAQSGQYKVVCDRATHMIKIVPLEDRTAGHVPVQSGFPSKQSAEEWVDKKFNSLECDPDVQIQQNQIQAQKQADQQQSSVQNKQSDIDKYPNARIYISYSNSNLEEILLVSETNSANGFIIGIEGMVGKTVYGVFGSVFHVYGGILEKFPDLQDDPTTLLGYKIPVLIGVRTPENLSYSIAIEAGLGWHPLITSTNGNTTIQGYEPEDHQFSGNFRLKAGFSHISILAQYEPFFTEFFKDEDFKLSLFSIGLNIEF